MATEALNKDSTGLIAGPAMYLAVVFAVLWIATPVLAHKVNVFAYVEGDRVVVEGYFSGKAKAMNSVVEVLDGKGKKIHEGKTDVNGVYSFALRDLPPFEGGLVIVLQAGMGHKAEYGLSPADLGTETKGSKTGSSSADASPKPAVEKLDKTAAASGPDMTVANREMMAQIVEKVVSAKIEPLEKMIGNQQKIIMEQKDKGPSLNEIVGGIGWIVGMVGIGAYFMSRRRMEKP